MSDYNATPSTTVECECNLTITPAIYNSHAAAAAVNVPIALFTLVSNAVVIVTVAKTRTLHRPANILLCSLAFSDVSVGAIVQPLLITRLLSYNSGVDCCFYDTVNKMFTYITPMMVCGSFVQVCVMCWDRYKAVSSPMEYRANVTNKKMLVIAVASWTGWLAFFNLVRLPPKIVSRPIAIVTMSSFVGILVVSQAATLKAMRRHSNQVAAAAPAENTFAREKKMVITLRWILATMLLSVLPQVISMVLQAIIGRQWPRFEISQPWVWIALCLSSSLNPMLYFWRHPAMRSAALQFIKCKD